MYAYKSYAGFEIFHTFEMLNQNQFNFLFSNHTPQAHKLNFSREAPISGFFY